MLHEIGHDALHREEAVKAGGFKEFNIFDMRQKPDGVRGKHLCFPNLPCLMMKYWNISKKGYDIQQIARAMHSDINLVALKTDTLIAQGLSFPSSEEYRNQFLK